MNTKSPLTLLAALCGGLFVNVLAASESKPAPDTALIARGEYLVEKIGLCADCHSPRNERGEFIREVYLGGAPLGFAPTVPMPVWAPVAPPIAGLPTMTDAQAVKFLMTGVKPDGTQPRPPMPAFRYNEADAKAATAYLRSLAMRK